MIKDLQTGLQKQKISAFTLIETLIYVVFLCVILSTILGIVYQTLQATDQVNQKIVLQTEAGFLSAKINWMLTGASAVNLPAINSQGSLLQVNKYNYSRNPLILRSQTGFLQLGQGTSTPLNLNSQNVVVSNFAVTASQASGSPEEIQVNFSLANISAPASPQNFQITKYLRQ